MHKNYDIRQETKILEGNVLMITHLTPILKKRAKKEVEILIGQTLYDVFRKYTV